MQEMNAEFLTIVAEQLGFVSAFLGGVSTTILVTIVIFVDPKRSVSWIVGASALAASSLLIAVVASWRLILLLNTDLSSQVGQHMITLLYGSMVLGYSVGFLSLITCIGLAGWIRSRKLGMITSIMAAIAALFFMLATPFGL
jgi:hypothetical protein